MLIRLASQNLCSEYYPPFEEKDLKTKRYFAKTWYDLLTNSPTFLGITKGINDPYTYTLALGCGYGFGGKRFAFTGKSDEEILNASSGEIYWLEEGQTLGPLDANLLIGKSEPAVSEYSRSNPLTKVGAIQNIYITSTPELIVKRVQVSVHNKVIFIYYFCFMSITNFFLTLCNCSHAALSSPKWTNHKLDH